MPPEPFIWAGDEFERKFGDEHYLVVGASGSGKSTLINHVLHSVVSDPNVRALVYDPKQELIPLLYGIRGFTTPGKRIATSVTVLHPFDIRGAAWNMAADFDSPISARQLATILVSDTESTMGSSEGFFTSAVRDILAGVLLAFIECTPNPGVWTFRDILLSLLYEPYLNFILELKTTRNNKAFPILHRLKTSYFGDQADARTKANIRATINAKLAVYEPVAAAWHRASQQNQFGGWFSLNEWLEEKPTGSTQEGSILVLGNDESARAALDPINQALFKRATELALARRERTKQEKEDGENQVWIFLDEVREAGKLDGLSRLLTKGRSKNVCVVMGFQDIDGLREVYGKEVANEICAQFNNIAVLRVNSPETAQWASDLFGYRFDSAGNSSSALSIGAQLNISSTTGEAEQERPFLYTDAFLFGSNAGAAKKVTGYRKGPDIGAEGMSREEWRKAHHFTETTEVTRATEDEVAQGIAQAMGQPKWEQYGPLARGFAQRATASQYLEPWDDTDWKRLGFDTIAPDVISWAAEKEPAAQASSGSKTKGAMPNNLPGKGKNNIFASSTMQPVDDLSS